MLNSIIFFSFLAFPPILLTLKQVTKKPSGWWLVVLVLIYVLLGWALTFFSFAEDQEHIYELLRQGRHDEVPEDWDSDGGRGVGALFLGWIFPLGYYLLCFALFSFAAGVWRLLQRVRH